MFRLVYVSIQPVFLSSKILTPYVKFPPMGIIVLSVAVKELNVQFCSLTRLNFRGSFLDSKLRTDCQLQRNIWIFTSFLIYAGGLKSSATSTNQRIQFCLILCSGSLQASRFCCFRWRSKDLLYLQQTNLYHRCSGALQSFISR